jgi:hypothetical protein
MSAVGPSLLFLFILPGVFDSGLYTSDPVGVICNWPRVEAAELVEVPRPGVMMAIKNPRRMTGCDLILENYRRNESKLKTHRFSAPVSNVLYLTSTSLREAARVPA